MSLSNRTWDWLILGMFLLFWGAAWLSRDDEQPQQTVDRAPAVLAQPVAQTN